ncbi:MAG TPA: cation-translocating P-type ATPase [Candidatus Macondimonas sp.]|nr:cation-translocating P-type ATPase [Candidatus Macondimonas sp.]
MMNSPPPSLASMADGLSQAEANQRLEAVGPNQIAHEQPPSAWRLLAGQFNSPVIWLLLGACIVSGALGEWVDALAIGAIVVINGLIGFFLEYRAENALLALRAMTAPHARVRRDGHIQEIPAAAVVPGDLLLLEAGDIVAADARLIEAHALTVNEAALTGESLPVEKSTQPVAADAPLAERRNAVFTGTAVANGSALAEVFATGMAMELGKIAHLLTTAQEQATPLQKRLAQVSRTLLSLCLAIVALVALLGWWRGQPLFEVFMAAVSLAVAAVPEGLPAIVTIALALGVQRMAGRHVLVRRLPAIETLGCATVICTDKTGTLTTGVMTVRELWGPDHQQLLEAAAANCDAELATAGQGGMGDPTEIAILAAAAQHGIHRAMIEQARPRIVVNPFDAERKRMSIRRADGVLYVKGAFDSLLPLCRTVPDGIHEAHEDMARRGLRVLAVAIGAGPEEKDLTLLGLIGIADPPRTEAIAAVAAAQRAGIRTVMITGDHAVTARAIARELGIVRASEDAETYVHARATPEDKLKIVRGWKAKGAIVAMTGDGVNDAPALREAHIGIAMGRGGTEVTREAADMVLTDDNFASIVAAVEEGRGIYDNIRKALVYLLAGNAGELLVMFVAALVGLPLPLLPLHLLWINLVTDGLPALALVTDPVDRDAMQRPPRPPDQSMLGRSQWVSIAATGLLLTTVTLGVFIWALQMRDLVEARNLAFATLVFGELFRAFAARSPTRLFFEVGVFTNLRLLGVVSLSMLLQIGIHHVPVTQDIFQIGALSLADCGLTLLLGLLPVTVLELAKIVRRRLTPSGVLHTSEG